MKTRRTSPNDTLVGLLVRSAAGVWSPISSATALTYWHDTIGVP